MNSKRWRETTRQVYPLSEVNRQWLIAALDAAFYRINGERHCVSPREQFEQSHRRWIENGRP